MVNVIIRLYSYLRDKAGIGEELIYNAKEGATVRDVLLDFAEKHGLLHHIFKPSSNDLLENIVVMLNGMVINQYPEGLDTKVRNRDIINIFPVISGG